MILLIQRAKKTICQIKGVEGNVPRKTNITNSTRCFMLTLRNQTLNF